MSRRRGRLHRALTSQNIKVATHDLEVTDELKKEIDVLMRRLGGPVQTAALLIVAGTVCSKLTELARSEDPEADIDVLLKLSTGNKNLGINIANNEALRRNNQ